MLSCDCLLACSRTYLLATHFVWSLSSISMCCIVYVCAWINARNVINVNVNVLTFVYGSLVNNLWHPQFDIIGYVFAFFFFVFFLEISTFCTFECTRVWIEIKFDFMWVFKFKLHLKWDCYRNLRYKFCCCIANIDQSK